MSTDTTTHEHARALAAATCDSKLTPKQRERLVALLNSLGTAVTLAPRVQEIYPDNDAGAMGYLVGAWSPVERDFAELAATVRCELR